MKQMCQYAVLLCFRSFACHGCLALIVGRLLSFSLSFLAYVWVYMAPVCLFCFWVCCCFFKSCPLLFHFQETNNESLHRAALSLFLSLALFIAHFRRAARGGNTIALRRRPPSAERKRIENPKYIHILTHTNTHMMGPKKMLLSLYASLLSISPLLPSLPPSTQSYIIPVLVYSENDGWMETHKTDTHTVSGTKNQEERRILLLLSLSSSRSPWS